MSDTPFVDVPADDFGFNPALAIDTAQHYFYVALVDGTTVGDANALLAEAGGAVVGASSEPLLFQIRLPDAATFDDLEAALATLQADARVDAAVEDIPIGVTIAPPPRTHDPQAGVDGVNWDWTNVTSDTWGLAAVRAPLAWNLFAKMKPGGQAVTTNLAVFDIGFEQHRDLPALTPEPGFAYRTWDAAAKKFVPDPMFAPWAPPTTFIHGTHVAGTIAMQWGNGAYGEGVTPYVNVRGYMLPIFDPKLDDSTAASAVRMWTHGTGSLLWALVHLRQQATGDPAHTPRVVSMSMGYNWYERCFWNPQTKAHVFRCDPRTGPGFHVGDSGCHANTVQAAIRATGRVTGRAILAVNRHAPVLFVVAAGNDSGFDHDAPAPGGDPSASVDSNGNDQAASYCEHAPGAPAVSGTAPPAVTLAGTFYWGSSLEIQMASAGPLGMAQFRWSEDGGNTWHGPLATAAMVPLGASHTAMFPAAHYSADDHYTWRWFPGDMGAFPANLASPIAEAGLDDDPPGVRHDVVVVEALEARSAVVGGHLVRQTDAAGLPSVQRTYFSNVDADVFAPGVQIGSSVGGNASSKMALMDGTSMATPHVSGVAAFLVSANDALYPGSPLDNDTLRRLLTTAPYARAVDGAVAPSHTALQADLYGALLGLDDVHGRHLVQKALADVDDGTQDGFERVVFDPITGATVGDWEMDQDGSDGKVTMADFRRLRDAYLLQNAALLDWDGDANNPKRELNKDGRTPPVDFASQLWPRADLVETATLVGVHGGPTPGAYLAQSLTPFDAFAQLYDGDPSGWPAQDLRYLVRSADVWIHEDGAIAKLGVDHLRVTVGGDPTDLPVADEGPLTVDVFPASLHPHPSPFDAFTPLVTTPLLSNAHVKWCPVCKGANECDPSAQDGTAATQPVAGGTLALGQDAHVTIDPTLVKVCCGNDVPVAALKPAAGWAQSECDIDPLSPYGCALATTQLDASGSSDPDGMPLTYSWSCANGESCSFAPSGSAKPQLMYFFADQLSCTVTETAHVTVTVSNGCKSASTTIAVDFVCQ